MRYTLSAILIVVLFTTCKKDKFTTVPQISFKSVKPDFYFQGQGATDPSSLPSVTIHVTDAEGDLGYIAGKDTSFIYFLNLRTNRFDSVALPNISTAAKSNFEGDVEVNMKQFLGVPNATKKDTIYYKVYIKDFAKNKSNEIQTDKPIYYFP
jgi:hypothetical protein